VAAPVAVIWLTLFCVRPKFSNTSEVSSLLFNPADAGQWVQQVLGRGRGGTDRQYSPLSLDFHLHQPQVRLPP